MATKPPSVHILRANGFSKKALAKPGGVSIYTDMPERVSAILAYEVLLGYEMLSSPEASTKLVKNVSKELTLQFGEYIDAQAESQHLQLHHVYEWGLVGKPGGRLFKLNIQPTISGAKIGFVFTPSKKLVPYDPRLGGAGNKEAAIRKERSSGKKNIRMATNTYIFKEKAYVMEIGNPVTIRPRKAKKLIFYGKNKDGIIFSSGVVVKHPGGPGVKGSFTERFVAFMNTRGRSIIVQEGRIAGKLAGIAGENIPSEVKLQSRGWTTAQMRAFAKARAEVYRAASI